jgi:hypothetical protein
MSGVLLCVLLGPAAAPVPQTPPNEAPPPRAIRPDISLVVTEWVPGDGAPDLTRVYRVGFRNGKPITKELVWEGEYTSCGPFLRVAANRYLISTYGSVVDVRDRKLINSELQGEIFRIDDTKVTYRIESPGREKGDFTFEYATGTVTRLAELKTPRIPARVPRSPDGTKAISWADSELFLHREGRKPRSLGTGFKLEEKGTYLGSNFDRFPSLWLDDERVLTQRDAGELVTVTLDGKVADVVTIKDFPKAGRSWLIRDRAGSIVYYADQKNFKIDLVNKTAVPTDWCGFGHGFEIPWESDKKFTVRHNGKDIGRFEFWPHRAESAPGHFAFPQDPERASQRVMVWSVATGEWVTLEFTQDPDVVGWIK